MIAFRLFVVLSTLWLLSCTSSGNIQPTLNDTPALSFLHVNDTYRIDAVGGGDRGGFGRVATVIRQLTQQGRHVILLHGGDFLFPSLESQLWAGEHMIEALNHLNELAQLFVTPGNHEFDSRDVQVLVRAVRQSQFQWIGDNFTFETGYPEVDSRLRHGFTFEWRDTTIGIFGLTLAGGMGGHHRSFAPVEPDYRAAAERAIRRFYDLDVDLIIGLTRDSCGLPAATSMSQNINRFPNPRR